MTDLTPEERITLDSYNQNAKRWSSAHLDRGYWAQQIKHFQKYLPAGRLLEVGCGGGRDARELIEAGYEYLGTDISANLLDEARQNNPDARFEEHSLYDLPYQAEFDGFWCAAVLLHIPKERIDKALGSIRRTLKPAGVGFIAVKEGIGEEVERGDDDAGDRFFSYWERDEFKKALETNGFKVLDSGYRPLSQRTRWLTYIVRRDD